MSNEVRCGNCGRDYPGVGADGYYCPGSIGGHCKWEAMIGDKYGQAETIKTCTITAFDDLSQKNKAESQARYDYYYQREMERLKQGDN